MYLSAPTRARIRPRRLGRLSQLSQLSQLPAPPSGPGWRQYSEIVTQTQGRGRYTIYLREHSKRRGMGYLGATGPSVLATGAGVAGAGAGVAASAAGLGAVAGPIGAAVGAVIGIIAGLWAAHDARVQGATTENAALNSAVPTFFQGIQAIFQAANAGQISGSQAATLAQQNYQSFWAQMSTYTSGPGRADCSGGGVNCGGPVSSTSPCGGLPNSCGGCTSKCTATCCVGCQDLYPISAQCLGVFASPTGGTVQMCSVAASKYGLSASGGGTLTYTPPAGAAGAANALSSLTSGSLASASVLGIPLWVLAAGGLAIALL